MKISSIFVDGVDGGVAIKLACRKCNQQVLSNYSYCPKCGRELGFLPDYLKNKELIPIIENYYKNTNCKNT